MLVVKEAISEGRTGSEWANGCMVRRWCRVGVECAWCPRASLLPPSFPAGAQPGTRQATKVLMPGIKCTEVRHSHSQRSLGILSGCRFRRLVGG